MEFAICDWVPDLSDQALDSLQAEGVTAMEPGPAFLLNTDEAKLKADAERLQARGIRIYSCHAPFGGENDISLLEEDKRRRAVSELIKSLARASLAGAECLVIHPSGAVRPEEQEQRLDRLRDSLETLVRKAEEIGMLLALENMVPGHLGCETASVRQLVDDFDSPFLGVCFDTGHAHLSNEHVLAAFTVLRERIVAFHLQDNDGQGDKHLQPPYGTIEWETLTDSLCAMGFDRPIAVEAPPWKGGSWGMLLREMRALLTGQLLTIPLENGHVRAVCRRCGRYCFGTPRRWSCGCDSNV